MENLLLQYMDERLSEREKRPVSKRHGPVITLSREAGCGANIIAESLLLQLKLKLGSKSASPWRVINKEIVQESARALEMAPEQLEYVFKAEGRKLLDEIMDAMTNRYHKSDARIRKTITDVIRSVVEDGFVVLVGRGGVAFTREIPKSLDILLQAPLDWRVRQICQRRGCTESTAHDYIRITDKERSSLVDTFYGKQTDESIYDVVFNCATLKPEQIASSIVHLMELKEILK